MLSVHLILLYLFLITSAYIGNTENLVDKHENCDFWATTGECDKNPNYMLVNCAKSCASEDLKAIQSVPQSFYDIVEADIDGKDINFENFRGKVVYIVNVASYCGYTESNYAQLKSFQKYTDDGLVMIIAPCNSFGAQEPGDGNAIKAFASRKGFKNGVILSKEEVNGAATRPSFAFLKRATGKSYISWNFDGKFLVDRIGGVHVPGEDLEGDIQQLLSQHFEL